MRSKREIKLGRRRELREARICLLSGCVVAWMQGWWGKPSPKQPGQGRIGSRQDAYRSLRGTYRGTLERATSACIGRSLYLSSPLHSVGWASWKGSPLVPDVRQLNTPSPNLFTLDAHSMRTSHCAHWPTHLPASGRVVSRQLGLLLQQATGVSPEGPTIRAANDRISSLR